MAKKNGVAVCARPSAYTVVVNCPNARVALWVMRRLTAFETALEVRASGPVVEVYGVPNSDGSCAIRMIQSLLDE